MSKAGTQSEFASMVADIQSGKVFHVDDRPELRRNVMGAAALAVGPMHPLIDVSVTYDHAAATGQELMLGEVCLMPPWGSWFMGYRDANGCDTVVYVIAVPRDVLGYGPGSPSDEVVALGLILSVFVGGQGFVDGQPTRIPTSGPMAHMVIELNETGQALRYGGVQLLADDLLGSELDENSVDVSTVFAVGHALDLLNMQNVSIAPKAMSRAHRRREERHGVRTNVITVTPRGSSSSSGGDQTQAVAVPLHSVRGHAAHYGACCPWHEPRGLLFGKYTGRVWVPQHARGDSAVGHVEQTFVTQP